nr:carbon-nitrogen hydrolase family protein [Phytoactinopolyspora mesophila]
MLLTCARQDVDLLVTAEFAVGGLPHTGVAAAERAIVANDLTNYTADASPDLTIVIGFTENAKTDLHSSAAVLRSGRVITVARKIHAREPGITAGDGSPVFTVAGIPCGIVICADATRTAPASRLAASGAKLLLCPLNNDMSTSNATRWREPTDNALAERARETECWVVSADVAGRSPGRHALAASRIYQPDGQLVCPGSSEPGALLVHDITPVNWGSTPLGGEHRGSPGRSPQTRRGLGEGAVHDVQPHPAQGRMRKGTWHRPDDAEAQPLVERDR